MADQRPFGRFRLPWLSAVTAPRPEPLPQTTRPTVEIVAPTQPQRPPFRPAGIAQVQPPPPPVQAPQRTDPQPPSPPRATTESQLMVEAPQRTEPQPPSPPRATTESQVIAQPASPSRAATKTRAASVPPSPSRSTSEAPAASQTRSPSRTGPQPRAASVPPSPTRTTTQPQPTLLTVPLRLSSSPWVSRPAGQTSSLPSSPSRRLTQVQPTVSQPSSPPKRSQTTAQDTSVFPPPTSQQAPKPAVSLSEAAEKVKEAEKGKKDMELKREEKIYGPAKEEEGQAKEVMSSTSNTEQKQHKEANKTMTAGSNGEQIKTVSSTHPKPRNKLTESHQKPGMSNGEHVPLHKEIRDDITKFVHKLAIGQLKYPMDDKPASIVTIAGENKGASMHVGSEPARRDESVHIRRGYKLNPDESTGATTDGEESAQGKKSKNPTGEEPVKKAFINSNTQSINNSMVLESSVTEENPGVHLVISHNLAEPIKPGAKPESLGTHKSEFSVTPAHKLTYDPTIRRRYLRGLFLESSDSDTDNPENPRRRGCRYICGEKSKDKDIGVL